MTDEEFKALMNEPEPQPVAFKNFPLCTNEGRKAFLEEYIFWGHDRLFEAVSHIWGSLNPPKDARCIGIGLGAGTGGTGKSALAKFLKRALRAALDNPQTLPSKAPGQSLDDYHRAAMQYFADDYDYYLKAIQVYADILDGQPGRHQPLRSQVLIGPWPQQPRSTRPCLDDDPIWRFIPAFARPTL